MGNGVLATDYAGSGNIASVGSLTGNADGDKGIASVWFLPTNVNTFIYEGYTGTFTTFLEPSVEHSDKVELIDNKNKERAGRYLIRSVVTKFGINGGRQEIELKNKAA